MSIAEAVGPPPRLPSLGDPWGVAVSGTVRLGDGVRQIRRPDAFTSVNTDRARNGAEVGGPRGKVGEEGAWARDPEGGPERNDREVETLRERRRDGGRDRDTEGETERRGRDRDGETERWGETERQRS